MINNTIAIIYNKKQTMELPFDIWNKISIDTITFLLFLFGESKRTKKERKNARNAKMRKIA